jgi:hypothetical protein
MTYSQIKKTLKLNLTQDQDESCQLLERMGRRFCVDYGYANAEFVIEEMAFETEIPLYMN